MDDILGKIMTPAEINDLLDVLEREVWYRVLDERIKKEVGDSRYKELLAAIDPLWEQNEVVAFLQEKLLPLDLAKMVEEEAIQVKKEFTKSLGVSVLR